MHLLADIVVVAAIVIGCIGAGVFFAAVFMFFYTWDDYDDLI